MVSRNALSLVSGLAAVVLLIPSSSPAQSENELSAMSLEKLLDLRVSSVSRREEKLQRTAAAVYVITREDIRRAGATDLADLLRMVPGVHVAQLNSSVWAISARGFASQYATKMLVLVDGRSVYDPSFSGVYWHLQNLVLADIERIEVIRGPGATMWGSNAVNGVVSITTLAAADTQAGQLTFDAGDSRPGEGTLRYGGALGEGLTYRVFGRQTRRSSLATESGESAVDGWSMTTGGFRADWRIAEKDSLTLDAGIFRGEQESRQLVLTSIAPRDYETVGSTGNRGGHLRASYRRALDGESSLSLQAYYDRREHTGYGGKTMHVFDFESQYNFRLGERHDLVLGGGHREIHDVFEQSFSFGLAEPHLDSALSSFYLQDELALVPEELYLTLGAKVERSSYTGFNLQPTVRVSWRPAFRHTVWGSVSRAVRTANRIERGMYVNLEAFEAGPLPGVVALYGRENTRSEELLAYEGGYRYQSNRRFWLDLAGFYNDYDHLSTVEPGAPYFQAEPAPPRMVVPLYFGNEMRGASFGAEVSVSYLASDFWTVRGSYSLLELNLQGYPGPAEVGSVALTEGTAPRHLAHFGSTVNLPRSIELSGNAYFVERLPALGIASYTRLDLGLTWAPVRKLTFGFVGQNLLGAHVEYGDYEGTPTSAIDRRFLGRMTWSF